MRRLSSTERVVLRDLATAGGKLNAFTFFRRYGLLPWTLVERVDRLLRENLVSFDGDELSLTQDGRERVRPGHVDLGAGEGRAWRTVPPELRRPRVEPFEPYIPSRRSVSPSLLRRAADQSGGEGA